MAACPKCGQALQSLARLDLVKPQAKVAGFLAHCRQCQQWYWRTASPSGSPVGPWKPTRAPVLSRGPTP
jgi:hypothetical protein